MNTVTIEDVLNMSMEMLIFFNDDGEVVFMNQRGKEELGYSSIQALNIKQIMIPIFQNDREIKRNMEVLEGKETETIIYRSDLTCFHAAIKCKHLEKQLGSNHYAVWILNLQSTEELAERLVKAENKIKESMKAKDEFVANITHELRTPVNGIKGHLYNLNEIETDKEKRKAMEIMLKCCDNMERLINNLMDFSKIEAGKFEIDHAEFSIRECVQHVVETNICKANEKGIQLSYFIVEEIPDKLIGDELRIIQILNNLVSNAVKFTAVGFVRIEVYCTMQKGSEIELTFLVIDTGIGISKEEQGKLFKIFSQVDGSITRKYGGTGIGLYVSKQLAELMDGHIEVESEKGKGTTFQVSINLSVAEAFSPTERMNKKAITIEDLKARIKQYQEEQDITGIMNFGSDENRKEIDNSIEKLLLAIEMKNWAKAEQFAEHLKKLCEKATEDVQRSIFRMKMVLRRENYESAIKAVNKVKEDLK